MPCFLYQSTQIPQASEHIIKIKTYILQTCFVGDDDSDTWRNLAMDQVITGMAPFSKALNPKPVLVGWACS